MPDILNCFDKALRIDLNTSSNLKLGRVNTAYDTNILGIVLPDFTHVPEVVFY